MQKATQSVSDINRDRAKAGISQFLFGVPPLVCASSVFFSHWSDLLGFCFQGESVWQKIVLLVDCILHILI